MPCQVDFSAPFLLLFDNLSQDEQELIGEFVFHFHQNGLKGFRGKFGPTDNVPHNDPDRAAKIYFAKRNDLWHVHVGHPRWNPCKNPMASYLTSDYVVHFQRFSATHIALVDYNSHNPMKQPSRASLFRQR
jgi:hypothetical protein